MTGLQRRIVKSLQDGVPLTEQPFKEIARRLGISEDELLAQIEAWKADGAIRRFGAILHHQQAGYVVNAMGVWDVPDSQAEEFGRVAASFPAVSHCYQRPRFDGFPYNLYTMIHAKSRQECEKAARAISETTGIATYALLYTTAEFKKTSPVYFSGAFGLATEAAKPSSQL